MYGMIQINKMGFLTDPTNLISSLEQDFHLLPASPSSHRLHANSCAGCAEHAKALCFQLSQEQMVPTPTCFSLHMPGSPAHSFASGLRYEPFSAR